MAEEVILVLNAPNSVKPQTTLADSCGRSDAPVCTDGARDVCGTSDFTRYRGCNSGQRDCADSPGNPDDRCCLGWLPVAGDNIDHAFCLVNDASWGGTCFVFDCFGPDDKFNDDF